MIRQRARAIVTVVAAVAITSTAMAASGGFDTSRMVWADRAINKAIEQGKCPGAVLLVGRGDDIVYRKAYGNRAVLPEKVPMTVDTVFDLASVSKLVGCATSIMLLAERGQICLTDRVSMYMPAFAANGKDSITIEDLLLHRSGLIPDNTLKDYKDGPAQAVERIMALKPISQPGMEFEYSDLNFIVLGELVRVVDGRPLDKFAREEIFEPLGMKDTWYNPPESLKSRCAPTQQRNGHWMIGEVHDPRAYALGGVAGHAGVFSTVDDMSRWCRMILNFGTLDGKRVLGDTTVREMIRERVLADGSGARGYGFDVDTGYSQPRGNFFEAGSTFGHTGFTGTALWIDPRHDAYAILLTNRVHPDGKGDVLEMRRRVANVIASAIIETPEQHYLPAPVRQPVLEALPRMLTAAAFAAGQSPARTTSHRTRGAARAAAAEPDVMLGIDVLEADDFKVLAGRNVAVITNHTGRDRNGNRLIPMLVKSGKVHVVCIFSPEHGLYGKVDERVGDTVDPETGLKVFSLYGKTRRPTPEMLKGVDTLLYDIQDVGARFYTYPATMGNCMEEAAKHNIKVIVLDRPNPITGLRVDGPISGNERQFTAYGPMPVMHGMTLGELARMWNKEYGINCDLTVVPVKGWKRSMWWDETGLTWINPSPNMRNLTQAEIYPAVCLLEATNMSVGRGTDQPFEFCGAPWVEGRKWAAALNAAGLPGVRFVPIEFTPAAGSKLGGQACQGVYTVLTDRDAFEPVQTGLTMAWTLEKLFGDKFEVDKVNNLLANKDVLEAMKTTDDPAKLPAMWAQPLAQFKQVREKYLMYK